MHRSYAKTVNCGPPPVVDWTTLADEYHGTDKKFSWHKLILKGLPVAERRCRYETRKTSQIRRHILQTYFKLMFEDIVKENVQFDFGFGGGVFLSLRIADRDRESYLYKYDIKKRGHDFIPYCVTSRYLWGKTHRYFLWRMGAQLKTTMGKEIENGRVYDPAPKVKYKTKRQYGLQLNVYNAQGRDLPDSEKTTKQRGQRKRHNRVVSGS